MLRGKNSRERGWLEAGSRHKAVGRNQKPPSDWAKAFCFLPAALCLLPSVFSDSIMVFDFHDCRKGDFDNFAVGAFDFDAGGRERLRGFHAANNPAHMKSINGYDFNVVLAVERL